MSTNRVLQYLHSHTCPHCDRIRETQRLIDRASAACEEIELTAGGAIEFVVPSSAERYLRRADTAPDDFEQNAGIRVFIALEPRCAELEEDLRAYTVAELRRLVSELTAAADRVEGLVSR